MTSKIAKLALALTFTLLPTPGSRAGDSWLNWRGPNQNGSVDSGTYPTAWTTNQIKWKIPLPGKGTSVPIVHQERIYLTSPADGQDAALAFDWSGKQLWQTKLGPEAPPKHRSLASSCNASPVTDGQHIFVYFKSGALAALDLNGKVRWQTNLVEQFGRENLFWDSGTSPTLTEKHVVVARMHSGESWLAAFDKATGQMAWKEARNFKVPTENDNGYATPLLFEQAGRKSILLWGADHLTAHDAASGKTLWTCGNFNPAGTGYWPGIATPVIVDGLAIVPVGRDDRGQASVEAIRLGGQGDVSQSHRAWKREDTGVFVPTPAAHAGRAYLLRNKGEVACLEAATGKTVYKFQLPEHRAPYYASPIVANGVLYAAREDGTVFTAKIHADRLELLSENNLGERFVATPVAANNRLLLRGDSHLFSIAQ